MWVLFSSRLVSYNNIVKIYQIRFGANINIIKQTEYHPSIKYSFFIYAKLQCEKICLLSVIFFFKGKTSNFTH